MGFATDHNYFYNIKHIDSGIPFVADQLVFQNQGFISLF